MKIHSFRCFWIAQTTISLADVVYIMVVTTFIYQSTGSVLFASLFPFIKAITRLVAGLTAPLILRGAAVTKTLLYLQGIKTILITSLLIGFTPLTSHVHVLFIFIFFLSFVEGWGSPLLNSVVPSIVPKDELVKANSSLAVSNQVVQMGGYTLTGFVVAKVGHMLTLLITVVLLWVSLVYLYMAMRSLFSEPAHSASTSRWAAMKDGWVYIWKNSTLRLVTLMDMIEGIAGQIWVGAVTLVYVKEVLHEGEQWWGYINASYYIGTILGGLLTLRFAKRIQHNLILSMSLGSFLFSICTFLYGCNSVPIVSLILCVAMGPAYQIRDVAQQTAIQTNISTSIMPQVYASRNVLLSTISSMSIFLIGMLSEYMGVRMVYYFGALLICISAGLSFLLLHTQKKQSVTNHSIF